MKSIGVPYQRLDIDHLCRNKICVNPEHLEAVTRGENLRRGTVGKDWVKVFRTFRNNDEAGGSSRWLVTPNTVELFIIGILKEERTMGYQQGVHDIKQRIYRDLDSVESK